MQIIFIQLNEINFNYVKKYIKKYNLKNFKKVEKDLSLTISEKRYDLLEPWIQWYTIHTGLKAKEHGVYRLGDSVNYSHPQIFEELENLGLKIGVISSMNSVNRLKKPSYFIPDPWTSTQSDSDFFSKLIAKTLRDLVNNNATGKSSKMSFLYLILIFFKFVRLKNYKKFINLAFSYKKKWNKAIFLDKLLHEIHLKLLAKNKPNFSSIFFNGGAHIQHHYLLNSLANNSSEKNPTEILSNKDDPLKDLLFASDEILGEYYKKFNNIIIATGLTQKVVDKPEYYYRLNDHQNFLKKNKVKFKKIEPRMSRDFLIIFENNSDRDKAFNVLNSLHLNKKKLFGILDKRQKSIFTTLTYNQKILKNDIYYSNNEKKKIINDISFVAIKNGHHDRNGFVYTKGKIKEYFNKNKKINISTIKKRIYKCFLKK